MNSLFYATLKLYCPLRIYVLLIKYPSDGNVYSFMAPDDSAPEGIRRMHIEHNVFKMGVEDVRYLPLKCQVSSVHKKKDMIDDSESS